MSDTLTFIGHGSLKLKTHSGKVIYIDPFFNGDYQEECDIALVTHNHGDHTGTHLLKKKNNTIIILPEDALKNESYNKFNVDEIEIVSVQAYNENHNINECVGYVINTGNIKIYFAGDTSKTNDMINKLSKMELDYAILPIDGIYNMNPKEASECAKIINAKYSIPIHNDPNVLETGNYSNKGIDEFECDSKIVLKYGESICLK